MESPETANASGEPVFQRGSIDDFDRFKRFAKKLIAVPKSEIDEQREAEKKKP